MRVFWRWSTDLPPTNFLIAILNLMITKDTLQIIFYFSYLRPTLSKCLFANNFTYLCLS